MSAASSDSAKIATASRRPFDPSLADPSRPSKLQRSSQSDISPADAEGGEEAGAESEAMAGARLYRAQRYLVAVEYDGTRFSGSQQQPNQRTVVGVLEDAGVHALSNVCHVDVERISKRKPGEVKNEGDIMVTDVRCVAPDFHARYKALERTYHYRLLSGPERPSIFEKNSAWHIPEDLNIQAMKKACNILVGHHDFSSFRAFGCQAKSPVRTLDELTVTEVFPVMFFPSSLERSEMESPDGSLVYSRASSLMGSSGEGSDVSSTSGKSACENGQEFGKRLRHRCFVVTARAQSFLYHQVRLMVGLLKAVGIGDLTTADVERILDAKTMTAAPPMAPAYGLYLDNVKYDPIV
ncbi:tRNA pseudouridine synthase A isoform X4 [Hordeum vulgare subsp. vulgare]|uniref:tRNA pseudouridine synthase A isoform X4 n=1 Tax=Hordeum vulgare subsp. vulgare TaxID=112509 RepID=UPI001D1A3D3B|nr:tRNA pseudouridine synthase A isoform X4 [Hordeum vulgare subsp. vulgare]